VSNPASSELLPKPHPPTGLRWGVLVLISLAMFGNYYIYDSISPLADLLKSQLGLSDAQIGTLNAIYSLPNIFMVLVGGIIIDRIGTRKATTLFCLLCLIGTLITAFSSAFPMMAAGRLVFGLGGESMIVAVTAAIAKWFKGKELSLAFGVNLTISRLGTFAALNSPSWAQGLYDTWRGPLLLTAGAAVLLTVVGVLYWILEASADRRYVLGEASETEKITFQDLFRFTRSYWLICALCFTFYSAVFPFQTFAVKFFQEAHGLTRERGGFLTSLLILMAMFATPAFGFLVDMIGRRALLMMLGSILLLPVFLMLAYAPLPPVVPILMLGLSFSLIPAVMWPAVAYVVQEKRLGTGLGLMTLLQNVGLAGFNYLLGWANDFGGASAAHPEGYHLGLWILSTLGVLGFLLAWWLRREELGPRGHGLETLTIRGPVDGPASSGDDRSE
jgi:MFS family permease